MPQDRTRKIVITGILGAISVFLSVTPLGFITWFPGVSLTIMHVPVILGAVLEGPWVGVAVGLIFGIASMIKAGVAPNGPIDVIFTNPLISVLPRLFIGPIAWLAWRALKRWRVAGLISAGITGSLANTVLVLAMIGLIPSAIGVLKDIAQATNVPTLTLLSGIAIANGLPEAAAATLIVLLVAAAWWGIRITRRSGAQI
jgi:uncharacterized membrane protein